MFRNLLAAMALVLAALGGVAFGGDAVALDDCIGIECADFFEEDPCADPNATLNWKMCGDMESTAGESPDATAGAESDPETGDVSEEPDPRPGPCIPRCLNWKLTYVASPPQESGASR